MLFHCDFYAFLANLGDNDRAGLCGEGCCAVDGGGGAEGFAIYAIEADLLVVVEAGDVDETTGWLDGDATGFNWFNTFGSFYGLNCSKSAPGFGCLIIRECLRRYMQSGIFYIWVFEYIITEIRNFFSITIDIFKISTFCKSWTSNTCYRIRDCDWCQAAATIESITSNKSTKIFWNDKIFSGFFLPCRLNYLCLWTEFEPQRLRD